LVPGSRPDLIEGNISRGELPVSQVFRALSGRIFQVEHYTDRYK
jgi:hypothetical protein